MLGALIFDFVLDVGVGIDIFTCRFFLLILVSTSPSLCHGVEQSGLSHQPMAPETEDELVIMEQKL